MGELGTIFIQVSLGNTRQVLAPLNKGAAMVLKMLTTSLAVTPHTRDASPEGVDIRLSVEAAT